MLRNGSTAGYAAASPAPPNQDLLRAPPSSSPSPFAFAPHDRAYAQPAANGTGAPYSSPISSSTPSTSSTLSSPSAVSSPTWRQAFLPSAGVAPPPMLVGLPPHGSSSSSSSSSSHLPAYRAYAAAGGTPPPPPPPSTTTASGDATLERAGRLVASGSPYAHGGLHGMPPSTFAHYHQPAASHHGQPPPPPPPLPFEATRSPPPPPPSSMPPPPPPSELEGEPELGERRGAKRKVPEDSTIPVEENFKCERDLSRFEKLGKLEEGAFGVVYRAKDKDSGQVVALKKMKRRKEEHEEGVPLSVLREIKIGVLLQGNVNIINIRDIIFEEHDDWEDAKDGNKKLKDDSSSGRGSGDREDERRRVRKGKGKEIYLVMDFIDHDLGRLLKDMRERKEVFSMSEIKSLLYQLLASIAHMHALGIIHRDIKTNNLLLGNDGILRLTDFGLSREYYMSDNNDKKKNKDEWAQMNGENGILYTPTVVTLRYRSMELLLGVKEYTTAIDMWSCGVIFAELVNGGSFFKSHLEIEQIYEIIELLGTPTERHWPGLARLDVVRKKKIIFPHQPHNLLHKRFGASLSRTGFELLSRMLHYNPDKRISAADALAHPFFSEEPLPQRPAPRYYDTKW